MSDRVYYNLNRKVWSVQGSDRRVRAHWSAVAILDVTFKVQRGCSFACGVAVEGVELGSVDCSGLGVAVTYNPHRAPFFFEKATGREVASASAAFLGSDRSVTAYGVVYGPRTVED